MKTILIGLLFGILLGVTLWLFEGPGPYEPESEPVNIEQSTYSRETIIQAGDTLFYFEWPDTIRPPKYMKVKLVGRDGPLEIQMRFTLNDSLWYKVLLTQ